MSRKEKRKHQKPMSNIGNWLKNFLRSKYKKRGNLYIETDDDFEADVIAECYKTGKPVLMSRPEDKEA